MVKGINKKPVYNKEKEANHIKPKENCVLDLVGDFINESWLVLDVFFEIFVRFIMLLISFIGDIIS